MENELEPHQIYLLQIMALPANVQIEEYSWDADDVPVGITDFWMIAFTGWFRALGTELLPGFAPDIIEINNKLMKDDEGPDDTIWTNQGLVSHPFWKEIRSLSKEALMRRGIELEKPDPNGWYLVLPEELH
jgi:hypothetical protein